MTTSEQHPKTLRIGARGSRLARWQAEWAAEQLRAHHPGLVVELVAIKTHGDRDQNSPLAQIGGTGLFTKEIQRALLDGTIDVAVHSLKDLPTQGPEELIVAAVPPREDPADALIAPVYRALEALPAGAKVGTGSPRRQAQLAHNRPDLVIVPLRGNVETRLNRALSGELDAVVLACAGLRRLGLEAHITNRLEPPGFLPAPGQGALGLECRRNDDETRRFLSALDDPATHRAARAERAALAELEGGCVLPMGAWARDISSESEQKNEDKAPELALDVAVFSADGRERLAAALRGPRDGPDELGRRAARALLEQGAARLLGTHDEMKGKGATD